METSASANHLPLHIFITGDPGSGKSQLAASAASPTNVQLVALFDSIDNASPYLYPGSEPWRASAVERTRDVVMLGSKPSIIPTYLCYDSNDSLIRKIWHFGEGDSTNTEGAYQWKIKLAKLPEEMRTAGTSQFIFDSTTLFEILYRRYAMRYNEAKSDDDEWGLHRAITNNIEDVFLVLKGFSSSVIVIGHIATDRKTGEPIVNLSGRNARNAPAMFGNTWICYINEGGEYKVTLKGKNRLVAKNTVSQSEDMDNDYAVITRNAKGIQWRTRSAQATPEANKESESNV